MSDEVLRRIMRMGEAGDGVGIACLGDENVVVWPHDLARELLAWREAGRALVAAGVDDRMGPRLYAAYCSIRSLLPPATGGG